MTNRIFGNPPNKQEERVVKLGKPISADDLASLQQGLISTENKLANLWDQLKDSKQLVFAGFFGLVFVVIGLVMALGAIFNDYLAYKQTTYQNLVDKVNDQNMAIKDMQQKIDDIHMGLRLRGIIPK